MPGGPVETARSGGPAARHLGGVAGARSVVRVVGRYFLETLGCPKNQVDSDKLEGYLAAKGYEPASDPEHADLVVVNTCAFIDAARQESIDVVLNLSDRRRRGARLVVTGCMAERYGDELRDALPEVDLVAGFGRDVAATAEARPLLASAVPVTLAATRTVHAGADVPDFDLLRLAPPRRQGSVGLRQGGGGVRPHLRLLRHPLLPGRQRSRSADDILAEVDELAGGRTRRLPAP